MSVSFGQTASPTSEVTSAGCISVTAIVGSNTTTPTPVALRSPITILGCTADAHIILDEPDVSPAHAAIVNTGHIVLVADLGSKSGTHCDGYAVKLRPIADGDIISIAGTDVTIHIDKPTRAFSDLGLHLTDPLAMPGLVDLVRANSPERMTLWQAVTILGSSSACLVRLPAADVPPLHSIFFATLDRIGIYNLTATPPLLINERSTRFAFLKDGDRLAIGAHEFVLDWNERIETQYGMFRLRLMAELQAGVDQALEPKVLLDPSTDPRFRKTTLQRIITPVLPNGVQAATGFVMDSRNKCTPELDIVVYADTMSAQLTTAGQDTFIPVESCLQVIEVRGKLTTEEINTVLDKCDALTRLHAIRGPGDRHIPPVFSLLAFDSDLAPTEGSEWERYQTIKQSRDPGSAGLDDLCVVGRGYWRETENEPVMTSPSADLDEVVALLACCTDSIQRGLSTRTYPFMGAYLK